MNMMIIHWKNKITDETGHGKPIPLSWSLIDDLNEKYPEIRYWAELVKE